MLQYWMVIVASNLQSQLPAAATISTPIVPQATPTFNVVKVGVVTAQ